MNFDRNSFALKRLFHIWIRLHKNKSSYICVQSYGFSVQYSLISVCNTARYENTVKGNKTRTKCKKTETLRTSWTSFNEQLVQMALNEEIHAKESFNESQNKCQKLIKLNDYVLIPFAHPALYCCSLPTITNLQSSGSVLCDNAIFANEFPEVSRLFSTLAVFPNLSFPFSHPAL